MALDKFIYGLLIFSLIVVTGFFVVSDVNTNYSDFGTSINLQQYDQNNTFDVSDNLDADDGDSRTMFDQAFTTEVTTESSENSLFSGAFTALTTIRNFVGVMGNIIGTVMDALNIPPFFQTFATIAVTIFITLTLIYLMLRFKG